MFEFSTIPLKICYVFVTFGLFGIVLFFSLSRPSGADKTPRRHETRTITPIPAQPDPESRDVLRLSDPEVPRPPFRIVFLEKRSGFWYPALVRRTLFPLCAALFACALSAHAVATPLWCEEGAAVFGGATNGVSRVASPAISVTPVGNPVGRWENGVFSVCAHTTAPVEYHWTLLPYACLGWLVPDAYGDAHLSVVDPFLLGLFPAMNGGPSHGGLSFWNFDQTGAHSRLWGPLSAPVASHPCAAGTAALCLSCGRRHGSEESCFHADDCASRTNLASACTCPPPFVRIGDALSLRLAGEEGCCCAALIVSPDLLSASPALGASVSNDWIVLAPTDRSPTIGGHSAQYRVFDTTGGVHRALTLRATAADLGIDPLPSDAPVPYDWQEGPEAYYITNGTLWLARRPEPYPVRVWNRSPSDARLVFDFRSDPGGPRIRIAPAGDPFSSMSVTNAAFAAPDADLTVWIDASGTNGTATLSLALSDPISGRTLLSESLCVRVADTDPGEHWRLRSDTDFLAWDFSDLPDPVWIGVGHAGADGVLTNTLAFAHSETPFLSLDLPPCDYDLEAYFPRVYDGGSWAAWSTNTLHVVHTEIAESRHKRLVNSETRALFSLTSDSTPTADWTLSPVVAGGPTLHRTLTSNDGRPDSFPGVGSVWLKAGSTPGVYTLTATHPACPASTTNAQFVVARVTPEALCYNWNRTASANDGLNLRGGPKPADAFDLTVGEWVRGGQNLPACYATNVTPVVEARFSVEPDAVESCVLYVLDGPFGGIAATNIAFAGGTSGVVRLRMGGTTGSRVGKYSYDLDWMCSSLDGESFPDEGFDRTTNHVAYTVFREPLSPWTNVWNHPQNAWTNALEFALKTAGAGGSDSETNALMAITRHLFSGHGLVYDTTNGQAAYVRYSRRMASFGILSPMVDLSGYMEKHPSGGTNNRHIVNCYDQAGGLATLGRILGIDSRYRFLDPFGYINPVPLVGIGSCNNPFYHSISNSAPLVDADAIYPERKPFGNHAFVSLNDRVFDSCAGPQLGTTNLVGYLDLVVDALSATSNSNKWYRESNPKLIGTTNEIQTLDIIKIW